MKILRFAIFGTGFWARFQLAAWRELEGIECVALFNRTRSKAENLAREFGVARVYDDAEALFQNESLDFADIITDVDTHPQFVSLAARYGVPSICQKPMAPTLEAAQEMVATCRAAGVGFWIHENWRFQAPIQALRAELQSGVIGQPFRAHLKMISGFPVFENQPFLREVEQFLVADLGSHIFDAARFLFGEASSIYCRTQRVHADIRGEDCVTALLQTGDVTTLCSMAYAENALEIDRFPQTFVFVEGSHGSLELAPDFWLRTTTKDGTFARRIVPPRYAWADPQYDLVHASIVPCNAEILSDLRGQGRSQNRAEENLQTVRLVFAAYESAATNQVVSL